MSTPAYYDSCDYDKFWHNRSYEYQSELTALKSFFSSLSPTSSLTLIDLGAGFGRLAPFYLPRVKSALLVEPSAKMRRTALSFLGSRFHHYKIVSGKVDSLPTKSHQFDIGLCVRVLHHLPDPEPAISELARVIKPNGYLILEFANKTNVKARLLSIFNRSSTELYRQTPVNKLSPIHIKQHTIPFVNHHPQAITNLLTKYGFNVKSTLSVSNLRSPFLKKLLPLFLLNSLETLLQPSIATKAFGPSLFLLAQKKP